MRINPCPFCGSNNIGPSAQPCTRGSSFTVWCDDCDAQGPTAEADRDDSAADEAVRLWNQALRRWAS